MKTGDELALEAMKKEHKRLSSKAARAKKEADEYMEIGTEAIAIHNELAEIVKSGEHGAEVLDKLDALKKRQGRVDRIMKKDLLTLCDKQSNAEIERGRLGSEIANLEFRMSMRRAK